MERLKYMHKNLHINKEGERYKDYKLDL